MRSGLHLRCIDIELVRGLPTVERQPSTMPEVEDRAAGRTGRLLRGGQLHLTDERHGPTVIFPVKLTTIDTLRCAPFVLY